MFEAVAPYVPTAFIREQINEHPTFTWGQYRHDKNYNPSWGLIKT